LREREREREKEREAASIKLNAVISDRTLAVQGRSRNWIVMRIKAAGTAKKKLTRERERESLKGRDGWRSIKATH
jgi:hypothetical protein